MGDEIIIDDKGQAAGVGDALSVHDMATGKDEHRSRLAGLVSGTATVTVNIASAIIYEQVKNQTPEPVVTKDGANIEAFEIEGGTGSIRGHYLGNKLSLRATTGLNLKVNNKIEHFAGLEECTIRRIRLWYRETGKPIQEVERWKPEDAWLSLGLIPKT